MSKSVWGVLGFVIVILVIGLMLYNLVPKYIVSNNTVDETNQTLVVDVVNDGVASQVYDKDTVYGNTYKQDLPDLMATKGASFTVHMQGPFGIAGGNFVGGQSTYVKINQVADESGRSRYNVKIIDYQPKNNAMPSNTVLTNGMYICIREFVFETTLSGVALVDVKMVNGYREVSLPFGAKTIEAHSLSLSESTAAVDMYPSYVKVDNSFYRINFNDSMAKFAANILKGVLLVDKYCNYADAPPQFNILINNFATAKAYYQGSNTVKDYDCNIFVSCLFEKTGTDTLYTDVDYIAEY